MFWIHQKSLAIEVVMWDRWLNSAKTTGPVTCDSPINQNGTVLQVELTFHFSTCGPPSCPGQATIIPAPELQYNYLHWPTILDLLQKKRDDLIQKQKDGLLKEGKEWPSNIRIEVPLEWSAFKNVRKELRGKIKKVLKEW